MSSNDDALKTATADLSSLRRVGHRLAMLDSSDKLQSVLDKLLARLLLRIGDNYDKQQQQQQQSHDDPRNHNTTLLVDTLAKIHQKLIEILSHVMKRVRDDRNVRLNCQSIIDSLLLLNEDGTIVNASVNPFTLNLSLAFLTLGVPRSTETEIRLLLPSLILLHGHYAAKALLHQTSSSTNNNNNNTTTLSHWHQISHLLIHALQQQSSSLSVVGQDETKQQHQHQVSKRAKISSSRPLPSQMISTASPTITTNNNSTTTTTSTTEKATSPSDTTTTTTTSSGMEQIHKILAKDSIAAGALYDLLLDLILYQSTSTTIGEGIPPAGCSKAGQERLQSNKAWVVEMASPARLSTCKIRILEWIAPTLHSCLFPNDSARTCTLLLAASGGTTNHQEVSNQANLYLKHFLDDDSMSERRQTNPETHLKLIMELLIHCVGYNNALLALSSSSTSASSLPTLGLDLPMSPAMAMPFRRRMVSDMTYAAMMMHVDKILTDTPQLFYYYTTNGSSSSNDPTTTTIILLERIGTLALLAVSKMLVKLRTLTGLTTLRGRPY
eukprot:scaffold7479_cov61-Cylindrotheca_fusiformis.AAC.2